jgi:hypothetical protein
VAAALVVAGWPHGPVQCDAELLAGRRGHRGNQGTFQPFSQGLKLCGPLCPLCPL